MHNNKKEILELTHDHMIRAAKRVANLINQDFPNKFGKLKIYPVPRGGISCAYLTINYISQKCILTDSIKDVDIIIGQLPRPKGQGLGVSPSAS